MQATIFGAACIERARILKIEKEKSMEIWNEDNDLEVQLGLENFSKNEAGGIARGRTTTTKRLFHAWREDWERVSEETNDVVHETKLLCKYARLRWFDPDTKMMFVADHQNLEWRRGAGWCVIGLREDGEMEPWPVKLLPALIRKTKQEASLNVEFVFLSKEEKQRRRAEKRKQGATSKQAAKGKRKRDDSDSDSDSDSD
jgi:hypothetical protein